MDLNIQGTIFKDVSRISKIDNFNYKLINYYRNSDIINAKINLNVNYYDHNYDRLINYNEDIDFRVMLDNNIVLSTFQISDLKLETLENQGFNILYDVTIEADRNNNKSQDDSNSDEFNSDYLDNEQQTNQDSINDYKEKTKSINSVNSTKINDSVDIVENINEEETIINAFTEETEEKLSKYLKDRNKVSHIREEKTEDLIGELKESYAIYKIVFITEHTTKYEIADKYNVLEENIFIDSNNPCKAIININE